MGQQEGGLQTLRLGDHLSLIPGQPYPIQRDVPTEADPWIMSIGANNQKDSRAP